MSRSRLTVKPAAARDVASTVDWYDEQGPGLSAEFLDELHDAFERATQHPLLYQQLGHGLRRAQLRRFPYAVYFAVEAERIVVVAVLHTHRDPAEWQRRER